MIFLSLWREGRGKRSLRVRERRLPALFFALLARRRRQQGFYDLRTLSCFRLLWRRRQSPASLLEYLLFRRDMGYRLPAHRIAAVLSGLDHLSPARRFLALALIAESSDPHLATVPSPPLACWSQPSASGTNDHWLARLHAQQQQWRDDFAVLLRQRVVDGICIVGNGGNLQGCGHGDWIDQHGLVVRFNRFRDARSSEANIGKRIDIWVAAPGFPGAPPDQLDWAIVTGPDMRFRRQNWQPLRARLEHGLPVLTVPLEVWRTLVAILGAPPSAGLLLLAWLKVLLGSWQGIVTIGMGVAPSVKLPYHHADPRQLPVGRHHWEAERNLLRQWRGEGLEMKGLPIAGDLRISEASL